MSNGFGRLGAGIGGLLQEKDPLQEAINAMKTQGGSLGNVRKYISNLQGAGNLEARTAVHDSEFPTLLPTEQRVAALMLQNMMQQKPQGMGFPPQPPIGEFLGQNKPLGTAMQQQISGVGQETRPGELPLSQIPFGKPPMMGGRTPTAFGTRPGQREFETEKRFGRVQQQFPGQPRLSEAWKSMLPMGQKEVPSVRERGLASAKETGELSNILTEYKRWKKEGYTINEAEQAAEISRKIVGKYGVNLTQILLDEFVDPQWMSELDDLDPSERQLLGLYKDEKGRTRWRPSEDEPTRIKQAAMLEIARVPIPTVRDISSWSSDAQRAVYLVVFGIPGVEGNDMAQKLFKGDMISMQEMPYIANPMIKRSPGSQEYIDGLVALQLMLSPAQVKYVEQLVKNPDQKESYQTLIDGILATSGKETMKEFFQEVGLVEKPGFWEGITNWWRGGEEEKE